MQSTRRMDLFGSRLWLCLAWLMLSLPARALDPFVEPVAYAHDAWLSDDGLPHNTIHDIQQSAEGYLWFATWNGVARFNGRDFTVYDSSNTPAFSDDGVRAMVLTADDSLLVATQRGGLLRYRDRTFTAIAGPGGKPLTGVLSMTTARGGRVLLGTQGQGLYQYQDGAITLLLQDVGAPNNWIQDILADADGTIWIATGRGLYSLIDGALRAYGTESGLAMDAPVYTVRRTRSNALYVGTSNGLFLRRDEIFEAVALDDSGAVSAVSRLVEDRDGNLWVARKA